MKIIKLTESTTKPNGMLFADRIDRSQSEIFDSLSNRIEEATEGQEILSIQYVEEKKMSGRIGYDRSDIGFYEEVKAISAYITLK